MIAIDTNVLLRFMLRDDEAHYQIIAPRMLHAEQNGILITHLVCMETDWVLESCYDLSKAQRIEFFTAIMSVKQFVFEGLDTLKRAILNFQKSNAEFSDSLIAAQAKTLGATETISFDKGTPAAGMTVFSDTEK